MSGRMASHGRRLALALVVVVIVGVSAGQVAVDAYQFFGRRTYTATVFVASSDGSCGCTEVTFLVPATGANLTAYTNASITSGETVTAVYHPGLFWARSYWSGFAPS